MTWPAPETAAGSGVFTTDEKAWVGGFQIEPRPGGTLVLDEVRVPLLYAPPQLESQQVQAKVAKGTAAFRLLVALAPPRAATLGFFLAGPFARRSVSRRARSRCRH